MRLYYFLDESEVGSHCSHWDAFYRLQKEGFLEDFKVCSFRSLEKEITWHELLKISKKEIISFHPNRIVLSHTGKRVFPREFFEDVRKAIPGVKFIYDERDVHGLIAKPIPLSTLFAAKQCDAVFLVAEGFYSNIYKRFGCRNVNYLSHVTDDIRFGKNYFIEPGSEFDVVMIGNFVSGKFINMPGVKFRKALADKFSKRFGKRFGLFGNGWNFNKSWQGPCKYSDQEKIIQSSYCSIGADHFPQYLNYFSDRLPIALYAGRPHLTYDTPGVKSLLKSAPSVNFYSDLNIAVAFTEEIINKQDIYNDSLKLNQTKLFVENRMLEIIRQKAMISI